MNKPTRNLVNSMLGFTFVLTASAAFANPINGYFANESMLRDHSLGSTTLAGDVNQGGFSSVADLTDSTSPNHHAGAANHSLTMYSPLNGKVETLDSSVRPISSPTTQNTDATASGKDPKTEAATNVVNDSSDAIGSSDSSTSSAPLGSPDDSGSGVTVGSVGEAALTPEPSTWFLAGSTLLAVITTRRRKRI